MWAVVVAQLAERSLLTSDIHGLNPNFSNFIKIVNCIVEKTEINEKEAVKGPF